MSISQRQLENARRNSAAVNRQRAKPPPEFDWDRALAGFRQLLDEVYGTQGDTP